MRKPSRNLHRAVFAVPADISAALDELGIDHLVRGNEAQAMCPNPKHQDARNPHWYCNLETGQHHCFSCGFGGSFTWLVSKVRGVRVTEANFWVRTHRITHPMEPEEIGKVEVRRAVEVRESDLWACTEPPAEELAKRGVSPEAAGQLEVLWDGKGWVFPIREPDNGRLIGWQLKRGKYVRNRPLELERPRSLFGAALVKSTGNSGDVIVVESPLNAARFVTVGFPRVVATYGIEFTDAQMAEIAKMGTGIVFAQDNDKAGQQKIARWLFEHPLQRQSAKVFDYGAAFEDDYSHVYVHPAGDGRDPGDLSDNEIRRGLEWATPGRRTRFEEFPQWR